MSELKVYRDEEDYIAYDDYMLEAYDKYEADKMIAELKADYKEACDRLQTANLIKDEQIAATRHQKYKRCLAMARYCLFWANYWHCCEPTDLCAFIAKERLYRKWHKRWLELAEKFKTN